MATAEIDPDGAGLKLSFFAMELQRRQKFNKAGVLPAVRTLPALKSAGISIIESGAGQNTAGDFHTATSTNSAMEGGSKVTLHAEDLVRGYAIDVWDGRRPSAGGEGCRRAAEAVRSGAARAAFERHLATATRLAKG